MPVRPFSRERAWLLPPSLDDALAEDHPARFVAAFVDAIDTETWLKMGVALSGDPAGAPAYDARALLGAWALGFMSGIRTSRTLEAACCDQIPYLWLTGFQRPDHNTLWRFYQRHRDGMRGLLKQTVRAAVAVGLVDLALQAVDGTRVHGNVAPVARSMPRGWSGCSAAPTHGSRSSNHSRAATIPSCRRCPNAYALKRCGHRYGRRWNGWRRRTRRRG